MAEHSELFQPGESTNWYKCWMAVYITRIGIVDVISETVFNFHADILKTVPEDDYCTTCALPNVFKCGDKSKSPSLCRMKGQCDLHCFPKPSVFSSHISVLSYCKPAIIGAGAWNVYRPCNFHGAVRDAVLKQHRHPTPSWRNTQCERWLHDPWQIAKCFMSKDGYKEKDSAEATDMNGLMQVMLTCKLFDNVSKADLSKEPNICSKVKEAATKIRHFEDMAISNDTVNTYIDDMAKLLSDPGIYKNPKAQTAYGNLVKLKNDQIAITTSEKKNLMEDAFKAFEERLMTTHAEERTKLLQIKEDLQREYQRLTLETTELSDKLQMDIGDLFNREEKRMSKSLDTLTRESIAKIEDSTKRHIDEQQTQATISDTKAKATKSAQQSTADMDVAKQVEQLKIDLKEDLVEFYKDRYSSLSISPVSDHDIECSQLYVLPDIYSISPTLEEKPVTSYCEIFFSSSQLFIESECGLGKTAFCINIISNWCHLTSSSRLRTTTKEDLQTSPNIPHLQSDDTFSDKAVIAGYGYIFYVRLPEAASAHQGCEIEDLIMCQIMSEIDTKYNKNVISEILTNERCLIIMDGLDQWTHPDLKETHCTRPKDTWVLPHTRSWKHCTIMMTTRPWKLSEINDQLLRKLKIFKIKGIVNEGILIYNGLKCLGKTELRLNDFIDILKTKRVYQMTHVPMFALYLLCMWFEGTLESTSTFEIYLQLLNMLFQQAISLTPDSNQFKFRQCSETVERTFPKCLKGLCLNEDQCQLFLSLEKLAFYSFQTTGVETFGMFKEVTVNQNLSQIDIKQSLAVGILSRRRQSNTLSSRNVIYTFLHRHFISVFATIHLSKNTGLVDIFIDNLFNLSSEHANSVTKEVYILLCEIEPTIACMISENITAKLSYSIHCLTPDAMDKIAYFQTLLADGNNALQIIPSTNKVINVQHLIFKSLNDEVIDHIASGIITLITEFQDHLSVAEILKGSSDTLKNISITGKLDSVLYVLRSVTRCQHLEHLTVAVVTDKIADKTHTKLDTTDTKKDIPYIDEFNTKNQRDTETIVEATNIPASRNETGDFRTDIRNISEKGMEPVAVGINAMKRYTAARLISMEMNSFCSDDGEEKRKKDITEVYAVGEDPMFLKNVGTMGAGATVSMDSSKARSSLKNENASFDVDSDIIDRVYKPAGRNFNRRSPLNNKKVLTTLDHQQYRACGSAKNTDYPLMHQGKDKSNDSSAHKDMQPNCRPRNDSCLDLPTTLQMLSFSQNLKCLHLSKVSLVDLDVSNCPLLQTLTLQAVEIENMKIEMASVLCCKIINSSSSLEYSILQSIQSLSEISLQVLHISPCRWVNVLFSTFPMLTSLRTLTVGNTAFDQNIPSFPVSVSSVDLIEVVLNHISSQDIVERVIDMKHAVQLSFLSANIKNREDFVNNVLASGKFMNDDPNKLVSFDKVVVVKDISGEGFPDVCDSPLYCTSPSFK